MQQGDIKLFQTDDGGDINVSGGVIEMSSGLETAVYLSLFGGNEDDDGRKDNPANWWGNTDEIDLARQYRSETQNLLQAIPPTSGNLRRIEDAAGRDLDWFLNSKMASAISVSVSIPGLNQISFKVKIEANGIESSFEYTENWRAA